MPGHRLPLTELATAIKTRLEIVITTIPVSSLVQQGERMPYIEIGDASWIDTSWKQGYAKDVVTTLNAYSDKQNMQEVNDILSRMIAALTSEALDLGSEWQILNVVNEGGGEVRKESDETGIYWHGSFRLRWKILDVKSTR